MNNHQNCNKQQGFSLIELMIGLVIGLIATMVITNVFANYDKQKRATSGTANAQTNGAIALYQLSKSIKNAGFGLPMFMEHITPLRCYESVASVTNPAGSAEGLTVDHDGNNITPEIGLSPVIIENGADGASDIVAVRFSDSNVAGAAAEVTNSSSASEPELKTGLGCHSQKAAGIRNIALTMKNSGVNQYTNVCEFLNVTARTGRKVKFSTAPNVAITDETLVSCLSGWNEHRFEVENNQLTVTGTRKTAAGAIDANPTEIVPEVVTLQAQYGVSAADDDNQVMEVGGWVDATGGVWGANMTVDNRNRIKAVRVAVVTRNGQKEQQKVSQNCDGATAGLAKVCIWNQDDTPANVTLSSDPNWEFYRYRTYETIIPLRNVLMNQVSLKVKE